MDLFSGLGGWSGAFAARGHTVFTVDLDPDFKPSLVADIGSLTAAEVLAGAGGPVDLLLASPPCECFSVASMGHHWHDAGYGACEPKTDEARAAIALLAATLRLIHEVRPRAWVMENPVGKMRKLPQLRPVERRTITLCQYGDVRRKPTDLWGGFPPTLRLHPPCSNGDPCHEPAPAGSKDGGTQGLKGPEERALLPRGLSLAVCLAMENWQGTNTHATAGLARWGGE